MYNSINVKKAQAKICDTTDEKKIFRKKISQESNMKFFPRKICFQEK